MSDNGIHTYIAPWLERITVQFEPKAKEAEKKYDYDTARSNLETSRIFTWIFPTNQRPAVEQNGLINTHNVTHQHTYIGSGSSRSERADAEGTEKEKPKKKEKVGWKDIVIVTVAATTIASICVCVYVILAKTEQRAQNYLNKTKEIKAVAEKSISKNNFVLYMTDLKDVANVQEKIDEKSLHKITTYKHAALTALAGTVTALAGAVALPAATTAVGAVAGLIIGGSVVYAVYNLATHWDDEIEAKEELNKVKDSLAKLKLPNDHIKINMASTSSDRQPAFNPHINGNPPTYEESLPPSYADSQRDYGYGYLATESFAPTAPLYPIFHNEKS